MIAASRVLALFLAVSSAQQFGAPQDVADAPCCAGPCADANTTKYYSIAWAFDSLPLVKNCGETCIPESDFWKFKVFEPHLTLAETDSPCADHGYTEYRSTQTHGAGPLSCTLDLYKNATTA